MNFKLLVVSCVIFFFTSCELLPSINSSKIPVEELNNQPICVWVKSSKDNNCKIEYWLQYWAEIEDMSWPERKKQIDVLSEKDADVLKKVFLSQGKSTPYQARLRAQSWVQSLLPKFSLRMRSFMLVAIYNPSQDLLEMESALVTLSKINTHQSFNIEEQQLLLNKEQNQIDQLLNIEASIMESIEEDKE